MTKWLLTRQKGRTAWRLVTFLGPNGGESVGIVDLVAIRKNHGTPSPGLKRGDLFEMILIQVKGGNSAWPSMEDVQRLRQVKRYYRARDVLLAEWKKGQQPKIYRMRRLFDPKAGRRAAWEEVNSVTRLFR